MKYTHILIILLIYSLTSCSTIAGEEIARIKVESISTEENYDWKTIELDLKAGDKIHLWSEMDMDYEGELTLLYQIQIIKKSDTLGYIKFNPMEKDITLGEIKTSIGNKTSWKFTGHADFWNVKEEGHYFLRAVLVSNANESLKLNKSEIVLKK